MATTSGLPVRSQFSYSTDRGRVSVSAVQRYEQKKRNQKEKARTSLKAHGAAGERMLLPPVGFHATANISTSLNLITEDIAARER